jgi:diaminopimelate epimerase
MELRFYKYQGTGNDFVILDNREGQYEGLTRKQVAFLCDRRFGIGADGLMLLSTEPGYDFKMVYFNSDGGESTMCGNGGRCLTRFAYDIGLVKTTYSFLAIDGAHEASIDEQGNVALKMNDVTGVRYEHGHYVLNTGSPHFVQPVDEVMDLDVYHQGREIRYSLPFQAEGINVNFLEQTEHRDRIIVRTYERGVEAETLSCGTGVTACAIVSAHNDNGFNRVEVETRGGHLAVEFEKKEDRYTDVWLIGPAVKVFEGFLELAN